MPMHFLTHEMLLFFTSIWTTNIHDNIHAKVGSCGPTWFASEVQSRLPSWMSVGLENSSWTAWGAW